MFIRLHVPGHYSSWGSLGAVKRGRQDPHAFRMSPARMERGQLLQIDWKIVELHEEYIYNIQISLSLSIIDIWAPAKTSDILEQLHQDIDTWYHHETLRNDRGDTKNDDSWYTCSPDFIANIKSSGTMRDTQKTMTISATSFRGCNRFSPLLIYRY